MYFLPSGLIRDDNFKKLETTDQNAASDKRIAAFSYIYYVGTQRPRHDFLSWHGLFAFSWEGGGSHVLNASAQQHRVILTNSHAILACHLTSVPRLPGWHGPEA